MEIKKNILLIQEKIERIAEGRPVVLVGACKTKPTELIREAVKSGLTVLGENRVQEYREKVLCGAYEGAEIHIIGPVQKNKVKYIAGKVDLIQSVDSADLMKLISQKAQEQNAVQNILLEVNIGKEQSKSGCRPEDLDELFETASHLSAVKVCGLMAIPPKGEGDSYFKLMYKLFVDKSYKKYDNVNMEFLSMGMSDDFEIAIQCGANMVRVGSAIFGKRDSVIKE